MALILHLSDLHLTDEERDPGTGDYKTEVIPRADRQLRRVALEATLTSLGRHLRHERRGLDAVVVTGDITYQCLEAGFRHFEALLGRLGHALPPPERIVVVPGNHDVLWGTRPGAKERYELFVKWVRQRGFCTPLLEGIDYTGRYPRRAAIPLLDCSADGFVVVAFNSANYCGVIESRHPSARLSPSQLEAVLQDLARSGHDPGRFLATWLEETRTEDVPRISQQQLGAIRTRLEVFGHPRPVIIGALHHHLLPVSHTEESKKYPDLVNLGQVREFMVTWCDVVLHGHKHTPRIYRDHLDIWEGSSHVRQECLVLSSGTVTTGQQEVPARLITTEGDESGGTIEVHDVVAVQPGADTVPVPRGVWAVRSRHSLSREGSGVGQVVHGATIDDSYRAMEALFRVHAKHVIGETRLANLMCVIEDGPSCRQRPIGYPDIVGRSSEWFNEAVSWWQAARLPEPGRGFNHGERLRRYSGWLDQIERLVEILTPPSETTRATASLLEPARDMQPVRAEFPAFCLFEASVANGELHCTGIFRKQEMHYWWPINVAELAMLQGELVHQVGAKSRRPMRAGRIVTVATIAVYSEYPPKVAIPLIDQLASRNDTRLIAMAEAGAEPMRARPDDSSVVADWARALAEWAPADSRSVDGDPVSLIGTRRLSELVRYFEGGNGRPRRRRLSDLIGKVGDLNQAYDRAQNQGTEDVERARERWSGELALVLIEVRRLLRRRLGAGLGARA